MDTRVDEDVHLAGFGSYGGSTSRDSGHMLDPAVMSKFTYVG